MAETVTMPKMGFDMAEGTLVRWVKAEGEPISKGDILAEIETDKATVEVESTYSGIVNKHLVDQGAVVPVGTPIAIITAPGEVFNEAQAPALETASPPPASPQTREAGEQPHENGRRESPAPAASQTNASAMPPSGEVRASPLARRLARERGVNLVEIQGSGPGGRVVRRDVEAAQGIRVPPAQPIAPAPISPIVRPVPVPSPVKELTETPEFPSIKEETVPVGKFRAAIGRRMTESKQQVPHFYVTHVYAVDALMALRKQVNEALQEGQRLSVNDFVVKAVALTLREFPNINSALEGDQIHHHGNINVGVAVAVENGLMTVVVRDADQKPIRVISSEIREMANRAKSGKVRPQDIEGSTFSTSNLGMFDVDEFSAIINPPEAGILAIGTAKAVPVVVDGELKVGMRMKATISIDHRISDGAEAAMFMQSLARYLENPLWLLL